MCEPPCLVRPGMSLLCYEGQPQMWKRDNHHPRKSFFSPMCSAMGLLHWISPHLSSARQLCHPVRTHVPPAVRCCRDGQQSLTRGLSCPALCLHGCPHPRLALSGVPRMLSSTVGRGGGRGGEEGEPAISRGHREFHPWARPRSHDTKEGEPEPGSPAPNPYQTRNVLYVFRGGVDRSLQQPLGISIVF